MKYQLSVAVIAGLMATGLAMAGGDDDHKAKTADGHAHEHHDSDAIGVAGEAAKASRTVTIDMSDKMRFTPATVAVRQGETVRFIVRNSGALKHEFVLGTEMELEEHYELMKKFPEMEHSDPNMVTVAPGKTGEVVWKFTQSGKVDFACLQPGHYDAGMKGAVTVGGTRGGATSHGGASHKH
jgi:uncharacterized cupredoxin-like copper-binding protein